MQRVAKADVARFEAELAGSAGAVDTELLVGLNNASQAVAEADRRKRRAAHVHGVKTKSFLTADEELMALASHPDPLPPCRAALCCALFLLHTHTRMRHCDPCHGAHVLDAGQDAEAGDPENAAVLLVQGGARPRPRRAQEEGRDARGRGEGLEGASGGST